MTDPIRSRLSMIHLCAAGTLLLVIGGAAALAVYPMYNSGRKSIAESESLRGQLKQLEGLSMKLQDVERNITETEEDIRRYEGRLPTRNQMDLFMNELAAVAKASGVEIEAVEPRSTQPAGEYRVMPMRITASGAYDHCYDFLARLRRMERLTRLDDAVVDAEQKTGENSKPGEKGNTRVRVNIATFMAK